MKVAAASSRLLLCTASLSAMLFVDGANFLPPKSLVANELFQKELPDTGEQWMTMPDGVEYQPAADLSPLAEYHLRRLTSDSEGFTDTLFVDGLETYYDEYAQAWRALGFYIDCDYVSDENRRLADENEGSGCQRFMLWAAYIDEDYSGNGVGEYMYYNRKLDSWDNRACQYETSKRCVKMDCHLPNTHFKLLGFFKEPKYHEWFEQLFKHEGDCVWTDEEFLLMQGLREVVPKGCYESGITAQVNGTAVYLYYDVKPSKYGEMQIGLYMDAMCVVDFQDTDSKTTMRQVACGDDDGGGDDCATLYYDGNRYQGTLWGLASQIEQWNRAFDVFKQCQPCKAYDLTYYVAGKNYVANSNGDRYNWTSAAVYEADDDGGDDDGGNRRKLQDDEDDEDQTFHCHDDAGANNVNQCMKFKTKTRMLTAAWRDVEMAGIQGAITAVQFPGLEGNFQFTTDSQQFGAGLKEMKVSKANTRIAWVMLSLCSILFAGSLYRLTVAKDESGPLTEPLVPHSEGAMA